MELLRHAVQTGPDRYQPEMNLSREEEIDQRRMAFIVGAVAVGLPTACILVGLFLSTCFYFSISHYYYAQFWGSVFIGCLIFIGTYLITWQGQSRGEKILATCTGPFAWGIALFPTSGPGCTQAEWQARLFADVLYDASAGTLALDVPDAPVPVAGAEFFTLLPWAATLHGISAAIMFSVLAYFSLVVFTREVRRRDRDRGGALRLAKLRRNRIYRVCGWIIVAMIVALGGRLLIEWLTGRPLAFWDANNMTLWCEAVALYAFGVSWMVKGRFLGYAFTDEARVAAP